MATIILAGWREGLQKIALANLQRELLQLPLSEAKQNVDRLLEVEADVLPTSPVILQMPDEVANEFARRADELGTYIGFVTFAAAKTPVQRMAKTTVINPQQAA